MRAGSGGLTVVLCAAIIAGCGSSSTTQPISTPAPTTTASSNAGSIQTAATQQDKSTPTSMTEMCALFRQLRDRYAPDVKGDVYVSPNGCGIHMPDPAVPGMGLQLITGLNNDAAAFTGLVHESGMSQVTQPYGDRSTFETGPDGAGNWVCYSNFGTAADGRIQYSLGVHDQGDKRVTERLAASCRSISDVLYPLLSSVDLHTIIGH